MTTVSRIPTKETKIRNTHDLRAFLVEQMEGIANGRVKADAAKGVANLAQQVYNTLNIEIRHAVLREKMGDKTQVKAIEFDA